MEFVHFTNDCVVLVPYILCWLVVKNTDGEIAMEVFANHDISDSQFDSQIVLCILSDGRLARSHSAGISSLNVFGNNALINHYRKSL